MCGAEQLETSSDRDLVERHRIGVWAMPEDHETLQREAARKGGAASLLLEQMIEELLDSVVRDRRLPIPPHDDLEYGFRATEFWTYGYYDAPRLPVMERLERVAEIYGLPVRRVVFLALRIGCAEINAGTFSLKPKHRPDVYEILGIAP